VPLAAVVELLSFGCTVVVLGDGNGLMRTGAADDGEASHNEPAGMPHCMQTSSNVYHRIVSWSTSQNLANACEEQQTKAGLNLGGRSSQTVGHVLVFKMVFETDHLQVASLTGGKGADPLGLVMKHDGQRTSQMLQSLKMVLQQNLRKVQHVSCVLLAEQSVVPCFAWGRSQHSRWKAQERRHHPARPMTLCAFAQA
jgi:hypothetical protein